MTNREFEQPEFATAIRGYDKLQVDDYIERLRAVARESEERAWTAESDAEFSSHTTVGPRVTEILSLAVEEAKEIRERAAAEAETIRAEARGHSERILMTARDAADESAEESEAERERARAEIEADRTQARREVAEMRRSKDNLLGDLYRLQEALQAAAGQVSPSVERAIEAHAEEPAEQDPTEHEPVGALPEHTPTTEVVEAEERAA